jgi:hypothetical protein
MNYPAGCRDTCMTGPHDGPDARIRETAMTRTPKIALAAALAVLTFGTATLGTSAPAHAWHPYHHRYGYGGAIAGGVAAGLVLGGIAAASAANTYEVRRECFDRDRFDRYGNYIRTVRVCRNVAD